MTSISPEETAAREVKQLAQGHTASHRERELGIKFWQWLLSVPGLCPTFLPAPSPLPRLWWPPPEGRRWVHPAFPPKSPHGTFSPCPLENDSSSGQETTTHAQDVGQVGTHVCQPQNRHLLFFTSFLELELTFRPLHPFKAHKSVVFIYAHSWLPSLPSLLGHFHHPKMKPCKMKPHSLIRPALGTHSATVSLHGFAFSGRFYKWSHILCGHSRAPLFEAFPFAVRWCSLDFVGDRTALRGVK